MEEEIWKDIPWYEWLYQSSDFGHIRSLYLGRQSRLRDTPKLLKPHFTNSGYMYVNMFNSSIVKKQTLHRLIAITFLKNPSGKRCVNHINWIKSDNRLENLEWCTYSENNKHAYNTWLKTPIDWIKWKDNPRSKRVWQYSLDLILIKEWDSAWDILRSLWIWRWHLSQVCNWSRKTAKWFIWRFI